MHFNKKRKRFNIRGQMRVIFNGNAPLFDKRNNLIYHFLNGKQKKSSGGKKDEVKTKHAEVHVMHMIKHVYWINGY